VSDRAFTAFGARVLLPHSSTQDRPDFRMLEGQWPAASGRPGLFSNRERKEMMEFLMAHKESGGGARRSRVIAAGIASRGKKREFLVRNLGSMLGAGMYEAYIVGSLGKSYLRSLFFRKIHLPGMAKKTYFELARLVNPASF
jgi:hypothetical protein